LGWWSFLSGRNSPLEVTVARNLIIAIVSGSVVRSTTATLPVGARL
jgi:hypothetical protein